MGFNRITDILSQLRERYPRLARRMNEAQALTHWEQAVGPQIAKHVKTLGVREGVLFIEVDHPIWRAELHARRRQILQKLNANPAQDAPSILDIAFVDRPSRAPQKT